MPNPNPNPKPKRLPPDPTGLRPVLELIEPFCRAHLTDEYLLICRSLAEKLAHKRPSPLTTGKSNLWACGVVRAIGWMNGLEDITSVPHLKFAFIDQSFGAFKGTGQAQSALIRKLVNMQPLDFRWTLPSRLAANPTIWLLRINGEMTDIRQSPRELQAAAFEKGYIPFIPADQI